MSSAFGYTYNVQFISSHEIENGIKHFQIPSKNTFLKSSYQISYSLLICDRVCKSCGSNLVDFYETFA